MKTLKYAVRFLLRSKSYTVINLLGLALSLACCIILARYIHQEITVDSHTIHPENIVVPFRDVNGNVFPCAQKYMDTVYIQPEKIVEQVEFITLESNSITVIDKPCTADILVTDSVYFHIFHYEPVAGAIKLNAPNDALIMESFARKVFGNENPIGKTLSYGNNNIVTIQGVLKEPACKTSYTFDVIVNIRLLKSWRRLTGEFIRLQNGTSIDKINQSSSVYRETDNGTMRYHFTPMKQLYWSEIVNKQSGMNHSGDYSYILLLTGVCLLVLVTGIINFINLYLVLMMKRSKEYSIKKIFGVHGVKLFAQLWMENALLITSALFVAWVLIEITAIPVGRLLGSDITYTAFDIWLSLGIGLLLPLLTSIYPYIKHSYLLPMVGIHTISTTIKSVFTRLAFLFVQCVITFLLIILSLYFGKHLCFLLHTEPGFRHERVLMANLHLSGSPWEMSENERKISFKRYQQIQQKLDESPLIEKWAMIRDDILENGNMSKLINDKNDIMNVQVQWVSSEFFDIYGLKAVEGTLPDKITDWNMYKVLMNESALKAFGYKHHEEAFIRSETPLWLTVSTGGEKIEGGMELLPVQAVVKDYYPGHITSGIPPIVFMVGASSGSKFQILCNSGKEKELLDYLKKAEQDIYGTEDFEYYWLDDKIANLYEQDRQVTGIYMFFAFVAIVISCLGLFGLSLFDIRQRYREIGIRKVNGAGVYNLCWLLIRKYMVVLACAFIVAIPVSCYLINMYTRAFIVKTPIGIGIFIIALFLISFIMLSTLLWQVYKATKLNPVEIIKTE